MSIATIASITSITRNGFVIEYGFGVPKSTTDYRMGTPFKEVIEEYRIVNEIALIGTIGGTFGLFTGHWLLDKAANLGHLVFAKCNQGKNEKLNM